MVPAAMVCELENSMLVEPLVTSTVPLSPLPLAPKVGHAHVMDVELPVHVVVDVALVVVNVTPGCMFWPVTTTLLWFCSQTFGVMRLIVGGCPVKNCTQPGQHGGLLGDVMQTENEASALAPAS